MWCKVLYIADLFCLHGNIRPGNITISLFFGALKLFFALHCIALHCRYYLDLLAYIYLFNTGAKEALYNKEWVVSSASDHIYLHPMYCIVLYCIVLYYIALHCIALHCIALHCIVLYCIVL